MKTMNKTTKRKLALVLAAVMLLGLIGPAVPQIAELFPSSLANRGTSTSPSGTGGDVYRYLNPQINTSTIITNANNGGSGWVAGGNQALDGYGNGTFWDSGDNDGLAHGGSFNGATNNNLSGTTQGWMPGVTFATHKVLYFAFNSPQKIDEIWMSLPSTEESAPQGHVIQVQGGNTDPSTLAPPAELVDACIYNPGAIPISGGTHSIPVIRPREFNTGVTQAVSNRVAAATNAGCPNFDRERHSATYLPEGWDVIGERYSGTGTGWQALAEVEEGYSYQYIRVVVRTRWGADNINVAAYIADIAFYENVTVPPKTETTWTVSYRDGSLSGTQRGTAGPFNGTIGTNVNQDDGYVGTGVPAGYQIRTPRVASSITLIDGTNVLPIVVDPVTYPVIYNMGTAEGGTVPAAQNKIHGANLTLQGNSGNLTRAGYTFAGWNTQADGGGTNHNASATYTANAALTLFPRWTGLPTYTLTYDGNGNTGGTAPAAQTRASDAAPIVVSGQGTLLREGHNFLGWATSSSATTPNATYDPGQNWSETTSRTLWAVWQIQETSWRISYVTGSLTGPEVGSSPITNGGVGTVINSSNPAVASHVPPNYSLSSPLTADASVMLENGVTAVLRVLVIPNSYTLSYNGGPGAVDVPAAQARVYGEAPVIISDVGEMTREGYSFAGWAASSSATVADATYAPGQSWSENTDRTLWAVWDEIILKSFQIRFWSAGTLVKTQEKTEGVDIEIDGGEPDRGDGYNFLGWSTANGASEAMPQFDNGMIYDIDDSIDLYAVYEIVELCCIEYDRKSDLVINARIVRDGLPAEEVSDHRLNLTQETLMVPMGAPIMVDGGDPIPGEPLYNVASYNAGKGWKKVSSKKPFSSDHYKALGALISKGWPNGLLLSDMEVAKNVVPDGAKVLYFPPVSQRPKPSKTIVNYLVKKDVESEWSTSEEPFMGRWVIVDKSDQGKVVAKDILIGKAKLIQGKPDKNVDEFGYGRFVMEGEEDTPGICVRGLMIDKKGDKKVEKRRFFYKTEPAPVYDPNTGEIVGYEPSSKPKKVRTTGVLKAPKFKPKDGAIKPKANTWALVDGAAVQLPAKVPYEVTPGLQVWIGASLNGKKPTTVRQIMQ